MFETEELEPDAMPELDRLTLLGNQAKANFGLILLADRKAQFLLRTALGLLGIAFIALPPAIIKLKESMHQGGHAWAFIVLIVLCGVSACCLLYAISHVIQAVRPRVRDSEMAHSEMFFAAAAQRTPEQFKQLANGMTYQEAVDDLTAQVYNSALISAAKYNSLDRAAAWMVAGGSLGVVITFCVLVAYGVMK